jgi:N-acetylglucosamine-6-phosphate deacetylase
MKIRNARVPGYRGLQDILVGDRLQIEKIIPTVGQASCLSSDTLDVAGDWVSLGGVDLQINGGLGLAFPDADPTSTTTIDKICQYLWQQGIDAFLPTIVTASVEKIQRSLSTLAPFATGELTGKMPVLRKISPLDKGGPPPAPPFSRGAGGGSKILGIHLEGPFLNADKRGAHPREHLLPLTVENLKRVLGDYAGAVKIITLAPELDPTGEVIPYLKNLGITVSLGHSLATEKEAEKAFNQGASMVTHAFNAMPSLHHRQAGLLGAAIMNCNVTCGLIADGQHVSPTAIKILLKASEYDQGIFLVSDALAPLGLPDGKYPWDEREIEVKNGTARLADGTLAGTTLPLLVGVQNLVKWGICDVETAISLATVAPRKSIGMPGIIGSHVSQLLRWKNETILSWERLIN